MFDSVFLQSLDYTALAAAVGAAVIISAAVAAIQVHLAGKNSGLHAGMGFQMERLQKDFDGVSSELAKFKDAIPRSTEVGMVRDDVTRLCGDFTALRESVDDRISSISRTTAEDLNAARGEMVSMASDEIERFADEHIKTKGVARDEFDALKDRMEKIIGSDESAERLKTLGDIFDSTQTRVINWQCQIIKLLRGGLAPEAEADLIASSGIPAGPSAGFLKKIHDFGITTKKDVTAYYVSPEWEWIFSYIDNPDWLQKKLAGTISVEKDYQNYVKNNISLIEDGLLLNKTEYPLETGRLDLLCTDKNGTPVGIELKYPAAAKKDKRQLAGYRTDYKIKLGSDNARFMLVAPSIPDSLKELLEKDGLEYREISMRS